MVDKAMVAVCDILGFRELVKRSTFEELVARHIPSILNLQKGIPKQDASIPPTHEEIFRDRLVGHAFFSDTVLLYSLSEDRYGYENLITYAAYLIAYPMLYPEYRFRVGISYGELYRDVENNVYAGKALVEAYELEKKQDWCGGAVTREVADRLHETQAKQYYLTQYDVPMSENRVESHVAIDWTQADHQCVAKEYGWLNRNYALPITGGQQKAERKLINTEKFHVEKCVQCREYRKHLPKTK